MITNTDTVTIEIERHTVFKVEVDHEELQEWYWTHGHRLDYKHDDVKTVWRSISMGTVSGVSIRHEALFRFQQRDGYLH